LKRPAQTRLISLMIAAYAVVRPQLARPGDHQ
jgi:hypothetical protein